MKRITIERYKNDDGMGPAGLIEGEDDAGNRWILFLDPLGRPEVFWPERAEDGAVVGDPINLDPVGLTPALQAEFDQLLTEVPDPEHPLRNLSLELEHKFARLAYKDGTIWFADHQGPERPDGTRERLVSVARRRDGKILAMCASAGKAYLMYRLRPNEPTAVGKLRQILDQEPDPATFRERIEMAVRAAEALGESESKRDQGASRETL